MTRSRVLAGLLVVTSGAAVVALRAQRGDEPQPWAVGSCYRAVMLDGEQQHVIRVLEASRGDWVRVQGDPMSPRVPGSTSRTPVWLNTALVFTLQQIECATFPR
jgi:hypothetical protein